MRLEQIEWNVAKLGNRFHNILSMNFSQRDPKNKLEIKTAPKKLI
jgi:hypothetical protein